MNADSTLDLLLKFNADVVAHWKQYVDLIVKGAKSGAEHQQEVTPSNMLQALETG